MKYLVMICQGHVPIVGVGKNPQRINPDVEAFIRYFLPKGQRLDSRSAVGVVRHFHLAFKGMDTEEVYDVLMELLVRAINKYDPKYTEKVKQVVGVIEHELSKQRQFSLADVNRHVEFDSNRYLRLLGRTGFLQFLKGGKANRRPTDRPTVPRRRLEKSGNHWPRPSTVQAVWSAGPRPCQT